MHVPLLRSRLLMLPLALACLLPAGCGSSGSDSSAQPTTAISGTVTAGPVDGCALTVLDGTGQSVAGPVTSHLGAFTVNIPNNRLGEALVFACSGGTYTDEATGANTTAGTLSAQLDAATLAAGSTVNLTPGSTVIQAMLQAGKSRGEAESAFAGAFGYTPDPSVEPKMNADGTDAQNLAGLHAGVFSRLTADLGSLPADQFDLLPAIAEDLAADSVLNGVGATTMLLPRDLGNRYTRCLIAQGTAMGLTADHLGNIPFAKVAETATYRIEYQPGMMGAMQGKTVFKLKITNRAGNPILGAAPGLAATMAMATMSHGTPVDSVTELGGGLYQGTVYYLMSSSMMGVSAGYWSLAVTVSGETATFYPDVAMSMGDTTRASLKDGGDLIAGMMGQPGSVRPYFLFKDSLTGVTGNHTLGLFLATRETLMSHPPLVVGMTLHDDLGAPWTVNTVEVAASTDGGVTWLPLSDNGGGHWSVAGLTGLTKDVAGTILVKLDVNGREKNTTGVDGGLPATFTVTPK